MSLIVNYTETSVMLHTTDTLLKNYQEFVENLRIAS